MRGRPVNPALVWPHREFDPPSDLSDLAPEAVRAPAPVAWSLLQILIGSALERRIAQQKTWRGKAVVGAASAAAFGLIVRITGPLERRSASRLGLSAATTPRPHFDLASLAVISMVSLIASRRRGGAPVPDFLAQSLVRECMRRRDFRRLVERYRPGSAWS